MYSDLEILVNKDMFRLGLDPSNKEDIKRYWEMMLQ